MDWEEMFYRGPYSPPRHGRAWFDVAWQVSIVVIAVILLVEAIT